MELNRIEAGNEADENVNGMEVDGSELVEKKGQPDDFEWKLN